MVSLQELNADAAEAGVSAAPSVVPVCSRCSVNGGRVNEQMLVLYIL